MPLFDTAASSPAELEARLRVHRLPEVGPKRFHKLINAFGSASAALSAPASAWRALGLPSASAEARRSPQVRDGASAALAWLERPGQHLLMWDDPTYPALLAEIADAPPLLFVAGDPSILERPQLGMVGSRRASKPGLDTATAFARSLAGAGFVITSGLALGIDGAAHQGALDVGGQTIGVLGTGIENFYPQRHRQLAATMSAQGSAVVSEFPLDAGPQASNFPRRNRIISGLSLGVLVVEASVASGSLITARLAAEQGREVYAIPGSIHHPGARGCHQLIRDGAVLVETVEHILETLRGWQNIASPAAASIAPLPSTTAARHPLLDLLHAAPHTSEGLALSSGWPLPKVLAALTELELDGRISSEAGRWFGRAR
ncbi:DNA-processing protein DprA [Pseudomonas sp. MH9.2]|uniref:DNA-processing protein DprA n=1 Tax=unclassified Pseudomonas TaxID=196821 RepID=UPI002AC93A12|nr:MULTISPECIES: DNA-processing protein DprA [unclassified Pseudomonas]MEB0005397.1 DNA-processing protein DprA [Pseudomonas sp. RTB2]MEB0016587.1 DNA-processing protein DprA [Pseudomonas sp. RTB3]MEB0027044.1 DNA-processing protein DprA [Pseudomonas sp. MH9.2]MEB0149377.1 DNA-processing protein DprA [Pseudomonas sp. CCC2.2]MEB0272647.1 DNA-processing protein DprA [Pseudomonas sp. 5B4]